VTGNLHANPLALEPGKALVLECETESIHLESEKFKATRGKLRLRLEVPAASAAGQDARWTVVSVADTHGASFAAQHQKACAGGCPLIVAAGAEPQLWAPRRVAPEQLRPDELLTVAAIKPDGLVLRASTFRAKELAALERGECKQAPGESP
jgi:hypothetical protein